MGESSLRRRTPHERRESACHVVPDASIFENECRIQESDPSVKRMNHRSFRLSQAPIPPVTKKSRACSFSFKAARYALRASSLPDVTDTVPFAERIRARLMGIHKKVISAPDSISPLFSGKDSDGGPAKGHEHVFIWPMDDDNDGRIDHLVIKAARPFEESELEALGRLQAMPRQTIELDAELELVSLSKALEGRPSRRWVSATPFVTSRHHRKGRGPYEEWLAGEIRRESAIHNLPEPESLELVDHRPTRERAIPWADFERSRKENAPLRGHGCRLTFSEEVKGPFALGALCHFGLGLFVEEEDDGED